MAERQNTSGFLERAAHALDIPAEAVAGVSYIEIIGTHEVLVENHKGILEYTENEVKVNTGKNILRITGQRLSVGSMNSNQLKLAGKIEAVQFIAV